MTHNDGAPFMQSSLLLVLTVTLNMTAITPMIQHHVKR
jgi:hypothetical protein